MARFTVDDCLDSIDNRYDLTLAAALRAREIAYGAETTLPLNNDKPSVISLREISKHIIGREILETIE